MLIHQADLLAQAIEAQAVERELQRELPHDLIRQVKESGVLNLRIPRQYGGPGASIAELVQVMLRIATADSNVAQALLYHLLFIERMSLMATPAQCARFLPMALQGTLFGGADSERSGSVRSSIQTRLTRVGAHYQLNGTKHYSTGALFSDVLKIRALNDEGQSLSVVIPAQRAGVDMVDDWDGMGQRLTASGTTHLHQVVVYPEEVVDDSKWGRERHHTGSFSQLIHTAIDTGIALAALKDAVRIGQKARAMPESGVERGALDPYVQQVVGRISASAHAAQAMLERAAVAVDAAAQACFDPHTTASEKERLTGLAAISTAEAKVIATEAALYCGQALFDAGGASSALRRDNHDRHWRNARTHTLHDPIAYKQKAIGNYRINGQFPPVSYLY